MATCYTTSADCHVIVDSSALVAILRGEPEAGSFTDLVGAAARCRISAANYLEAAIVADGTRDPLLSRHFDEFLLEADFIIEPVTAEQAQVARQAYRDFGKGSGHPARLNSGDCFAYALAHVTGEPLLFKGDDFAHTDITSAAPQ
jgi:ribonuclease VapC